MFVVDGCNRKMGGHPHILMKGDVAYMGLNSISISDMRSDIVIVVVLLVVAVIISRWLTRVIRFAFRGSSVTHVSIVVNIMRAAIAVVVVYLVGENVFGVELDAILQTLGITTLVVSLGMQDLIKNLVAGMQILMSHLFSAGDQLEVNGDRGEVMDINWRQTTMRDKDGNSHVIPNALLMGSTIVRRNGSMAHRYIIECDIKPGLRLDDVAQDIEQLADQVLDELEYRAEEHTQVRFLGSTANGVRASIRIFLLDIEQMAPAQDAVMRVINSQGYLADWTNESPSFDRWR